MSERTTHDTCSICGLTIPEDVKPLSVLSRTEHPDGRLAHGICAKYLTEYLDRDTQMRLREHNAICLSSQGRTKRVAR